MKRRIGTAIGFLAATLAGCTTMGPAPTEVTRFHLGAPLERGTLAFEAAPGVTSGLEFDSFADAVKGQAFSNGFTAAAPGAQGQYLAVIGFTRTDRPGPPRSSGVSIGLGGDSYGGGRGGGVGIGGGVSFPIGRSRPRDMVFTDLSVQIRRRSDGTAIWEGHARTSADSIAPDAQTDATARKLSAALFQGFPGISGRTITVK